MSDLIELAREHRAAPGPHANRMACWLARSALEDAVNTLLAEQGIDVGKDASTRSRLTCLEVAFEDRPELVSGVEYAWSRLSEACHQHAFQLSPTHSEALHLLDLVERLSGEGAAS